jgi:Mg/Co/Ni transporter MgtE
MIKKLLQKWDVFSLYYREYIVGFIAGFILGAIITWLI